MTRCIDDFVALGSRQLMPATQDPRLRVAVQPVEAPIAAPTLQAFDERKITPPVAPELPSYTATPQNVPATDEKPTDRRPVLPVFGTETAQPQDAKDIEQPKAKLPVFGEQLLGSAATAEAAKTDDEDEPPHPTLPVFGS